MSKKSTIVPTLLFMVLDIARSIPIVSPLKVKSVAALQFQFYLYEYLPNTV